LYCWIWFCRKIETKNSIKTSCIHYLISVHECFKREVKSFSEYNTFHNVRFWDFPQCWQFSIHYLPSISNQIRRLLLVQLSFNPLSWWWGLSYYFYQTKIHLTGLGILPATMLYMLAETQQDWRKFQKCTPLWVFFPLKFIYISFWRFFLIKCFVDVHTYILVRFTYFFENIKIMKRPLVGISVSSIS